jgi:hypothetical protein
VSVPQPRYNTVDQTDARNAPALGTSAPAPVTCHGCLFLRLGGHRKGNIASKLDGKSLTVREAAQLVEALARAMQRAHSHNVVHPHLKPANFLRSEPFLVFTQPPSIAALRSVQTAASSMTFGSRAATMALDQKPWAAMKPCNARTTTEYIGDGR